MTDLSIKSANLFNNYTNTNKVSYTTNTTQEKNDKDSKALMNTLAGLASAGAAQVAFCSANEEADIPEEDLNDDTLSGRNEFGFPIGLGYFARTTSGEDSDIKTENTAFDPYGSWGRTDDSESSDA